MNRLMLSLDNLTPDEILEILKGISTITSSHFPLWGVKLKPTTLMACNDLTHIIKHYYGLKFMVDAKLHDTPQAMEDQLHEYVMFGADLVTVHLTAHYVPEDKSLLNNIVGVTVMTTLNDKDCINIYAENVKDSVAKLVLYAQDNGYKNIVCSANDIKDIKNVPIRKICPGIRPSWYLTKDDQKRTATPKKAIENGADILVIGRPILQFKNDPAKMLEAIYMTISEMEINFE